MLTIIWQHRIATNLQFVKIAISAKHRKAKHSKKKKITPKYKHLMYNSYGIEDQWE